MNIYVRRSSRRYYTFCRAQPESSNKLAFLDALLPDTNIAGAKVVAGRLREAVAEAVIVMSDQSILPPVTVSIGVTEMKPSGTGEMLMTDVRAALDRAKENGRNCLAE
jgi:PleD family two-component response regulator